MGLAQRRGRKGGEELGCSRSHAKARGLPPGREGCRAKMSLERWAGARAAIALRKPAGWVAAPHARNHSGPVLQRLGSVKDICFLT